MNISIMAELLCDECDKHLVVGNDTFLKANDGAVYCEGCYDADPITFYTVGGTLVGDEINSEVFVGNSAPKELEK